VVFKSDDCGNILKGLYIFDIILFFFFFWHYSAWWTLTSSKIVAQFTILEASQQNTFYGVGLSAPHATLQSGRPGYLFLSESSSLTCLVYQTLPIAALPPA
jgi:hypothetical protein